jgi:hypothetical protein
MRLAKQLSVRLINKPGRLAAVLVALNKRKVELRALTVMDSGDRGTVRFIPDDVSAAIAVLDQLNVRHDATDVLLVEVPNNPGAFRRICERLASEKLNIDYAYMSFGTEKGSKGAPIVVVKVNNLQKAQRALEDQSANGARRKLPGRRPVHAR